MQMQNSCVCNQKLLFTAVVIFCLPGRAVKNYRINQVTFCNLLDNVDKCTTRQQMPTPVDTQLGVLGCSWVYLGVLGFPAYLSACLPVCRML